VPHTAAEKNVGRSLDSDQSEPQSPREPLAHAGPGGQIGGVVGNSSKASSARPSKVEGTSTLAEPMPTAAPGPHRRVRLAIPTVLETSAEYKARIGGLLARPGTHVYVDTSFLMWATKIGPASREELLKWLRDDLGDRVHVPTWAGHEYLRHHVAGTIVTELDEKAEQLSQVIGGTFNYFRPFLDDPALPASDGSAALRTGTRDAINTLERLVRAAKDWRRSYTTHASAIIEFINERAMDVGSLYDDFEMISDEGAARYEGRVPPGFKDKGKKGTSEHGADEGEALAGANRYGDLIFWKEILEHAGSGRADAIIILTNDRKNDWRMGGQSNSAIEAEMLALRKSWRPVPRIHPMLALEASTMGINDVSLIDSQYLAAYLRDIDAKRVGAFADVAIVPDPPAPQTEAERREATLAAHVAEKEAEGRDKATAQLQNAAEAGLRFPDDAAVKVTLLAMRKALLESRGEPDERGASILERVRADVEPVELFSDALTADTIAGMSERDLAKMTRALHERILSGEPGYTDALVDLIGLLGELPPATAAALTLGLVASMYLEPGAGTSRIPPRSPASSMLLELMTRDWALNVVKAITARLTANARIPLWIPDAAESAIPCIFDIETETVIPDELRSMKINGVELLIAAQNDERYRLRSLFDSDMVPSSELLDRVASLYIVPRQCLSEDETSAPFALTDTIGFRPPDQVFRSREEK